MSEYVLKRRVIAVLATLVFALQSASAVAHKCEQDEPGIWLNSPIDQVKERKLYELFSCMDTSNRNEYRLRDRTACNWFVAKAVSTIWSFNDFANGAGFLSANEIADKLASNQLSQWRLIGTGNDQTANREAAATAAANHPVIAAYKSNGPHGHVALILPGGTKASSSWGVEVPRSASMTIDTPNNAYIGCRVSNAFGADKKSDVRYYSRSLDP